MERPVGCLLVMYSIIYDKYIYREKTITVQNKKFKFLLKKAGYVKAITQDKIPGVCGHAPVVLLISIQFYISIYNKEVVLVMLVNIKNLGVCSGYW